MSSMFGQNVKISLFGESHSSCVGLTIDSLPAGIDIDKEYLERELKLRKKENEFSTSRNEKDEIIFLSGVFNDKTTGGPLTFILKNSDQHSCDYVQGIIRPSHADLTSYIKYNGFNDYRGGGMFSGRLTAPLIILGALIKQILKEKNIKVYSHVASIGDIEDQKFDINVLEEQLKNIEKSSLSVIDYQQELKMLDLLKFCKDYKDSIGGKVETIILNLPIGVGEPFFDGLESYISHLIFSIGGVKGIIFGNEEVDKMLASEYNDQIVYNNNQYQFLSNNNGGINGGISNGNLVVFSTFIKPTPSIGKKQKSINVLTKENIDIELQGRFDVCIVHRVKEVIQALTYYAIYDLLLFQRD